jgi:DNA-binding transcriptional regulator YiaG
MESQMSEQREIKSMLSLIDGSERFRPNPNDARTFAELLESGRKVLELTAGAFAAELRISEPMYRQWLAEDASPHETAQSILISHMAQLLRARLRSIQSPPSVARAAG